jgi:hypothetical protein
MADTPAISPFVRHHLRIGWWAVLLFLALGIALEAMHGFKVDWYLNVGNETRRLMWTLAHAHGVLLGLLHIALAVTVFVIGEQTVRWRKLVSIGLTGATVLLPGGFFLGGLIIYSGDPGRGVLLVPLGGLLLLMAVGLTAWRVGR